MSIKPKFADAIFDGSKTIEVRRRRITIKQNTCVFVYSSWPIKKVIGKFFVARVEYATKQSLLDRHREIAATHQEIEDYIGDCQISTALHIEMPIKYKTPKDLSLFTTLPPQSWIDLPEEWNQDEKF